jgi:Domain of unknown function (DUF4136)
MQRREWILTPTALAALWLPGCAAMNNLTSEVTTYGEWPAGRKPGSYAFERLPSQQTRAAQQAELEQAAAKALEQAGFVAASDVGAADVVVQLGARVNRADISPWDDPLWWRWGAGYWRSPAWRASRAGFYPHWHDDWHRRYERHVALLLRDRVSNKPLYEAHAQTEGGSVGDATLIGAMFAASMKDFPSLGAQNPRRVTVPLTAAQ